MEKKGKVNSADLLEKAPTGIKGFDEITGGGLPKGRPTLIVGGPGCGKTLFAMEFLVNGSRLYNEPGVFISFEESDRELRENSASIGFDLRKQIADNNLIVDYIRIEPEKIIETGEYDLEGLFIRLDSAIDEIGAKRVALDTVETVFASFTNAAIVRSEMCRLFRHLKDKSVTAVVTGESGGGTISRHGLEEYISDMVISLDHRIVNEIATRRLRIMKYRGSAHGTNEYPFLIESDGLSVLPITSIGLESKASMKRISSGVPDLDKMMGGKGFYEGSTILVSGSAGTGKTSFAAEFARRACEDGKKVLYYHFEESPNQIIRNMRSIGIDFEPFIKRNRLVIKSDRPTSVGLEMHLARIHRTVETVEPDVAIFDPISALSSIGSDLEIKSSMIRLSDFLKMKGITSMFTDLKHARDLQNESLMSSIVDTWLLLETVESGGEKNRLLRLVKSRGMAHSNQVREFSITDNGIRILIPYVGTGAVLTGTARYVQEEKEKADDVIHSNELDRLKASIANQRRATEVQIAALKAEIEDRESELERRIAEDESRRKAQKTNRNFIEGKRIGYRR